MCKRFDNTRIPGRVGAVNVHGHTHGQESLTRVQSFQVKVFSWNRVRTFVLVVPAKEAAPSAFNIEEELLPMSMKMPRTTIVRVGKQTFMISKQQLDGFVLN